MDYLDIHAGKVQNPATIKLAQSYIRLWDQDDQLLYDKMDVTGEDSDNPHDEWMVQSIDYAREGLGNALSALIIALYNMEPDLEDVLRMSEGQQRFYDWARAVDRAEFDRKIEHKLWVERQVAAEERERQRQESTGITSLGALLRAKLDQA